MTHFRIVTDARADQDVESAHDWYEDERPGLGLEFLTELRAAYDRIVDRPFGYQVVAIGVRRARLRRFPYGVYYVVEGDVISVVAVMHLSRDPAEWQRRRD